MVERETSMAAEAPATHVKAQIAELELPENTLSATVTFVANDAELLSAYNAITFARNSVRVMVTFVPVCATTPCEFPRNTVSRTSSEEGPSTRTPICAMLAKTHES